MKSVISLDALQQSLKISFHKHPGKMGVGSESLPVIANKYQVTSNQIACELQLVGRPNYLQMVKSELRTGFPGKIDTKLNI